MKTIQCILQNIGDAIYALFFGHHDRKIKKINDNLIKSAEELNDLEEEIISFLKED